MGLLVLALVAAVIIDRGLLRDLGLIAAGLVAISLVPITTDISTGHMFLMGTAMILAVGIPYSVSRFVFKDHAVRFPVLTGHPWTRTEKWYLVAVVIMGYALLFICTVFILLRRHLPFAQANVLQAILFTSFLWELGFHAWAPAFIFPFALIQAIIFTRTKSLSYIVSVHPLFDFVLFLVLLQAHNRDWFDIFIY
jgi:membrane protease YdiL (CAAX protease family)